MNIVYFLFIFLLQNISYFELVSKNMQKNPHFAVILSGCGRADGSEIHESVSALLCLEHMGCTYQCFAPNIKQAAVINHLNNQPMHEERNVLIEAARIARGNILDLAEFKVENYDQFCFSGTKRVL